MTRGGQGTDRLGGGGGGKLVDVQETELWPERHTDVKHIVLEFVE